MSILRYKSDWVTMVLSIGAIITFLMPRFVNFNKMRIMTTASMASHESMGGAFYLVLSGLILIFLLNFSRFKGAIYIRGIIAGALIVAALYLVSESLKWLPLDKTDYSRLSIGPSMWLWLFCMVAIIVKCTERTRSRWWKTLYFLVPLCLLMVALLSGHLNGLAITLEYNSRSDLFWGNLLTHLTIFGWVMLVSILIGVPLGYLTQRNSLLEQITFGVLNVTETIPTIAFIALMMVPLSIISNKFPFVANLGITGIGVAPAFFALVLYALFPIVHNTRAAFKTIDPYYVEVAQAMGMSRRRILFTILLPMSFPTILSGVRIAQVYTITGVTLAAFIGGGGLGLYMIQTESLDLVLLGVIPVVVTAFVADSILRRIGTALKVEVN